MSAAPVNRLHEVALLIAAETEIDRVLERVLRAAQRQFGAASASVFLWDRATGRGRRFTTLTTDEPGWKERDEAVRPGGLTETVLRRGRTVAIEDAADHPLASARRRGRSGAVLAAPLRCHDDLLGVLYANFDRPRRFDARARRRLEILGGYAATAVRNARLIEAERRATQRHRDLLDIAGALGSSTELPQIFELAARHGRALLGADAASIDRLRPDGGLVGVASDPAGTGGAATQPWLPDAWVRGVLEGDRSVALERPAERLEVAPAVRERLPGVELAVASPILADSEAVGLFWVGWARPHRLEADDPALVEMVARQAGLAVQNARVREQAIEAARLDGAIKTAQAAAHELSQPLAVVVGYAELIQDCTDPEDVRRYAGLVNRAALDAAARLDKFRNVLRFVELRFGDLDPILDLDRSAATD